MLTRIYEKIDELIWWLVAVLEDLLWVLLDWIGELVEWAWFEWIKPAVEYVVDQLRDMYDAGIEWAGGMLSDAIDAADSLLETLGIEATVSDLTESLQGVADIYAQLDWVLPITAAFGMITATYALIIAIRFGRWLLSFIPGVATG